MDGQVPGDMTDQAHKTEKMIPMKREMFFLMKKQKGVEEKRGSAAKLIHAPDPSTVGLLPAGSTSLIVTPSS